VGDKQGSLPGLPVPGDGGDGDEGGRGGEARLKVVDRRQLLFRTVDVEQLIGEDHPARAIWEFVGQLDLSRYTEQVRSVAGAAGRPAFDPQLLVSLWVYSYSRGVSSARAIERLCDHDPAYQWLTGMEGISAHTLSDFRVAHAEALRELFVQTLGLLSAEGLITLERVMQDGTRVRACASSSGFRRKARIETYLKQARKAMEELDAQTEEESSRRVQGARKRARRERRERLESALKQFDKLKASKSRVDRVSTSDPDARVMKQAEGGSAPSYNVQIATDAAHSLIVDIEATQAGSDYQQLTPAMERIEQTLQRAPDQVVVDGGYISSHNIVRMAKRGIDLVGPEPGASRQRPIGASPISTTA
jgi:transposase